MTILKLSKLCISNYSLHWYNTWTAHWPGLSAFIYSISYVTSRCKQANPISSKQWHCLQDHNSSLVLLEVYDCQLHQKRFILALVPGVGEPVAAVEGEEEKGKGCETNAIYLCVKLPLCRLGPLGRHGSRHLERLRVGNFRLLQVGQLVAVDADCAPDESEQWHKWGATIAQWIRLCLPSCYPGFESQARDQRFYQFIFDFCHIEKTKINKKRLGLAHLKNNDISRKF